MIILLKYKIYSNNITIITMSKNNNSYIFKISKNVNLGDGIVYFGFIKQLCNIDNITYIDLRKKCEETNYILIGSVLRNCDSNSIICGTGFISENADLGSLGWTFKNNVYNVPKNILFVRGKKTRDKFIKMGVNCPESYGDLGLLLPLVYKMKKSNIYKYKVGILPHYVDKERLDQIKKFLNDNNISYTILNIMSAHKCQNLINELSECEFLITSTLHGIILGIAYNIKTIWIKFSSQATGNDFKYHDFFSSLDYEYNHVQLNNIVLDQFIKIPKSNLLNLGLNMITKIPFYISNKCKENRINEWTNLIKSYY